MELPRRGPARGAGSWAALGPVGSVTRGTTGPNRLRRVDRWTCAAVASALRTAADPLVVDLGFGETPVTTVELATRLRRLRPDVEVVGIEIDPTRVRAAQALRAPGLSFRHGGFELALDGRRPVLVRALNVLRQYPEDAAARHGAQLGAGLAPGGLLVEGTCDELGRRAAWIAATPDGPVSLTLAARLADLHHPGELAERLPKSLIHRNVPGEGVHAWLTALDAAWDAAAPYSAFGARQRWARMAAVVLAQGWPLLDRPARWRLGELTVAWSAVRPAATPPPRAPS